MTLPRLSNSLAVLVAATALIAPPLTTPALAQTAQAGLGGPVVPGLCLLSREAVFANAAVGKAATARLRQLTEQAQAEVDGERRPIEADIQAYRAQAAKLPADQRASREQALSARLAPVEAKAQQRSREIEATRQKALQRLANEAQPVIAQAYRQKNCGILVDRNSVLGGNLTNDLTADVVKGLDARISTITFDRETLPPAASVPASPR